MSLPARLRAFGISKALDYLERDPDANLPKLMDWLDKYTGERLASPYRELFHRAMRDPGNNWHRLIKSMYTDIDSRVLKKIFENFVIHAGLMDWPSRNAAGKTGERPRPLGGDHRPLLSLRDGLPRLRRVHLRRAALYGVRQPGRGD